MALGIYRCDVWEHEQDRGWVSKVKACQQELLYLFSAPTLTCDCVLYLSCTWVSSQALRSIFGIVSPSYDGDRYPPLGLALTCQCVW